MPKRKKNMIWYEHEVEHTESVFPTVFLYLEVTQRGKKMKTHWIFPVKLLDTITVLRTTSGESKQSHSSGITHGLKFGVSWNCSRLQQSRDVQSQVSIYNNNSVGHTSISLCHFIFKWTQFDPPASFDVAIFDTLVVVVGCSYKNSYIHVSHMLH